LSIVWKTLVALAIAASLSGVALAAPPEPVQRSNSTAIWFENWGSLYNATLKVEGPDGFQTSIFVPAGSPTFYLRDASPVVDGVYRFELSAATTEVLKIRNPIDQGRGDAEKTEMAVPYVTNGSFVVLRGVITVPDETLEEQEP